METSLAVLLSWQFLLSCLVIVAMTHVIRLIIQFFILDNPRMPGSRSSRFWRELFLPIAPFVNGIIIGLVVRGSLYPETINDAAARVAFQMVAGLMSGLVYRVVVGMLRQKIGLDPTVITTTTTVDPNASNPVETNTVVEPQDKTLDKSDLPPAVLDAVQKSIKQIS